MLSTRVASIIESADPRRISEIENENESGNGNGNGNGNEDSIPRSSKIVSDVSHALQNKGDLSMIISSNSKSAVRHGHDDHVGNAAEDEMTQEPQGDIF
jgi:hypothetical protein